VTLPPSPSRVRGRGRRRRGPENVQEALFEVQPHPELRYYRQMLDALNRSGFGADPLDAERTVSRLFGTVWASQGRPRDGGAEEAFGLALVDYAGKRRMPVSVALLRTVARIAPIREVREAAAGQAARLVASGLPEPRWTQTLSAGRCWAYEDVFGDESTIICEFEYRPGGDPHAIVVHIDQANFSVATDVMFTDDVEPLIRDLRNETHRPRSGFTMRLAEPPWVRAFGERAFARTDLISDTTTEPTFADLRALAMSRLATLPADANSLPPEPPPPTDEHRTAVVAQFLATLPAELRNAATAATADRILEHAGRYDPARLLRVSPGKWESFVFDWLPEQNLTPGEPETLADVIRAWSRWAGQQLPDSARTDLATALDEILIEALGSMSERASGRYSSGVDDPVDPIPPAPEPAVSSKPERAVPSEPERAVPAEPEHAVPSKAAGSEHVASEPTAPEAVPAMSEPPAPEAVPVVKEPAVTEPTAQPTVTEPIVVEPTVAAATGARASGSGGTQAAATATGGGAATETGAAQLAVAAPSPAAVTGQSPAAPGAGRSAGGQTIARISAPATSTRTGVVATRPISDGQRPAKTPGSGRSALIFALVGVVVALAAGGLYLFKQADAPPRLTPEDTIKEFLSAVFLADDATRVSAVTCSGWDPVDAISRTTREVEADVHVSWDQVMLVTSSENRASGTARLGLRRPDDRQPSTYRQWRFSLVNEDGWRVCEARPVT
jgi:hypothetical protein